MEAKPDVEAMMRTHKTTRIARVPALAAKTLSHLIHRHFILLIEFRCLG
jgi:hypothetical protein